MNILSDSAKIQIPYLFGIIIFIYIFKPSVFFKPNGKIRLYGLGYDDEGYKKTLYTFQFSIIILVLLMYYISHKKIF